MGDKPKRMGDVLTARQREVFGLVARGLTNKEIAGSLGITERGVAAQVSRLLARFAVPNRAGLIARVMSEAVGTAPAGGRVHALELTPEMRRECDVYEHSKFMVGLTLGADNLIVYVNEACRRAQGIGVETPGSSTYRARRSNPATAVFRQGSRYAFRTGLPVSIESQATRWRRDDGTWGGGSVDCVLQPVRRFGLVAGVLWICSPA
jgi:DNA-binding CsgD family transcriptional regulator